MLFGIKIILRFDETALSFRKLEIIEGKETVSFVKDWDLNAERLTGV